MKNVKEEKVNFLINKLRHVMHLLAYKGKLSSEIVDSYYHCNEYVYHYVNEDKLKESYKGYG